MLILYFRGIKAYVMKRFLKTRKKLSYRIELGETTSVYHGLSTKKEWQNQWMKQQEQFKKANSQSEYQAILRSADYAWWEN